mgnify:CR=1 FL=1
MEQTVQSVNTQLLLRLLQDNDMPDQAQELRELLQYVTGMERQCDAILEELRQVKDQLSKLENKQHPVAAAFAKTEQKIEAGVERVREQLQNIRQTIEDKARSMVEGFHKAGVSALRKTSELLGVRKLLCGIQENLGHAAGGAKRAVERLEAMGGELRTASGHLHNAGRAAAGRETQQVEQRPEGRFQSAVLFPMRGVRKTLSKMQVATATAMYNVASFEQELNSQGEALALPAPRQAEQQEESPAFVMTM